MTMLDSDTGADGRDRTTVRVAVIAAVCGLAAGLVLGAGAYAVGRGDDGRAQEHVGSGYVGENVATLRTGDHGGVAVTAETPWIDKHGTLHENSWPSCLPFVTEVENVHWADVQITNPDGGSYRQVTYVDCSRTG